MFYCLRNYLPLFVCRDSPCLLQMNLAVSSMETWPLLREPSALASPLSFGWCHAPWTPPLYVEVCSKGIRCILR